MVKNGSYSLFCRKSCYVAITRFFGHYFVKIDIILSNIRHYLYTFGRHYLSNFQITGLYYLPLVGILTILLEPSRYPCNCGQRTMVPCFLNVFSKDVPFALFVPGSNKFGSVESNRDEQVESESESVEDGDGYGSG